MKYKNIIKTAFLVLAGAMALASCQNKEFDEVTSLSLKRCLEPLNLNARVNAAKGDEVTFSWDVNKDADHFNLVVYTDEAMTQEYLNETVEAARIPYVKRVDADATYYFKVQAQAEGRESSNWAVYDGSFKTYAVKDNLYMKVTGKTEGSISLSWSKEVSDYLEVDRIEARPVAGGDPVVYTLSDSDRTKAATTVPGLKASTEYDVVLFFKSASRGAATVWTLPSAESLTRVSDKDALKDAVLNGTPVYLTLAGSPYEIGSTKPVKGSQVFGETDADGNRPVIICDIKIGTDYTGGDFYFEGVDFDGAGTYSRIFEHNGGELSVGSIKLVNCAIHNYTAGLFYDNNADAMTLGEFAMEGCDMFDISGGGGDCFDVRKTFTVNKITLVNNTIYDGVRTLFRVDAGLTCGDVVFDNNTVKNIANFDNSNCRGIFAFRSQVNEFSFKKNLFLYEEDANPEAATLRSNLFNANAATLMPNTLNAADNYIYIHGKDFFKQCSAQDAKMTVLEADPCYNGKGNFFQLANEALAEKKVGAAKWWNAFVEEPEDLTQEVTAAPHVWDFKDARLFAGNVKKQMVRDGLLITASEAYPVNADGAINFTVASELNRKGVPTDAFLSFKVNQAGSIDFEVADPGKTGSSVVFGLLDDNGYAVLGGAVASAANPGIQKIVVPAVAGEGAIMIHATGPVSLTRLAWSADVLAGNKVLATPKPVVEPVTLTEGDETAVTVSWEAVPNAADYVVVFNKRAAAPQTELSYTVAAEDIAALKAGLYTFTVTANPAAEDIYYTKSDAGSAAFAIQPKASAGGETVTVTWTWDFSSSDWQQEFNRYGAANTDITNWNLTYDNLTIVSTAKSKYNTTFFQWGGKGTLEDRYMKFTAPGQGTLKVWASNTGGSEDLTRCVTVNQNGVETSVAGGVPSGGTQAECEFSVMEGDVYFYCTGNALRFYKAEYTYSYTTGGETPKEDYVWDFSTADWQAELAAKGAKNADITNWVSTVEGLTWTSTAKSKWNTATINEVEYTYIQAGGKGTATDRVFTFTVQSAGIVTVLASNTGGSAATDDRRPAVVDATGAVQFGATPAPASNAPQEYAFEVEPGQVSIYPDTNGLRFYKIEFHSK